MKHNEGLKMKIHHLSKISGALILALGLSTSVLANTTTSAIKGKITGPQGNGAVGTKIKIIHVPSGTTKTAVANNSGLFTAKGLRVGGPYKIIVDSDTFLDTELENVFLTLGDTYPVNVALEAQREIESIQVTASPIAAFAGSSSQAAHFDADDLAKLPAINRDIKDIIRTDSRIFIDESNNDAIVCGGGNPRFNSLTLDGVRLNDNFGLNTSGFPTTRVPFSFDSLDQISVELAPFGARFGSFTACNINAVTKSGGNEVKGGLFYDFTSDSFTGDSIEGVDVPTGNFTEKRYGAHIGFPLIKDKLFVFASYEKLEGAEIFQFPGLGEDGPVTQADIDRIVEISDRVYGYDAGGTPGSLPVDDEKLLVKFDWNINDDHRASFVYNYNDGFELRQSDDSDVTLDSHFYESGAELKSYVVSLFSDWSGNLSTHLSIGRIELDNRQESLDADSGFGEVRINVNGTDVFIGPDDSRQSNELNWENITFRASADYYLGDHIISAGYELERLTAFNLFVQHTEGEYRFNSIEDFESGFAARVEYGNAAGTSNPSDASQEFTYDVNTFFIQDEYALYSIDATLTFGLRYDFFTSDDEPRFNQNFQDRYGFANNETFDGIDLIQPRVGFNWTVDDNLTVRAGVGLYSGGNPNVWLSNSFSNDGLVNIQERDFGVNILTADIANNGRPIFEPLQSQFDAVANTPIEGGDGDVNAVDPDFDLPSEWKYSIGGTYVTDSGYTFSADVLHNRKKDSATFTDLALQESGRFAPDGRPILEASVAGRSNEYLLTNSDRDGKSTIITLGANKEFDFGLNVSVGYSYISSEDVNPTTSSVSGSNFGNVATTNPLDPELATSDFEIPHRFTLTLSYDKEFISGLNTNITLFGQASEGSPFSYTFSRSDRDTFGDNNFNGSRQLLYVPTLDDATVVYADGFDLDAFNSFIDSEGLSRGRIQERNEHNADWWTTFDLKFTQDIPGFAEGHSGALSLTIKNVGNLLNDDWGVFKEGSFVGNDIVSASINDQNQYVFESFIEGNTEQDIVNEASLWEIRLGVSYNF